MPNTLAPVAAKTFDSVGFIMDYEEGELGQDEVVAGFQHLIDSGLAYQLQGSYGRTATRLIEQGFCTARACVKPAVGVPKKVGPYEGVTMDAIRDIGSEKYRILLYAAYNAMGLIGSECNGIVVLSEDRCDIVCDELGRESSGYFGPSQAQLALFEKLSTCTAKEFRATVNASKRLRYSV